MTGDAVPRGWWGMTCWTNLSAEQHRRLIEHGNLPIWYRPEATAGCGNAATVCIEIESDEAPGPRFYCAPCALTHLAEVVARHA